MLKLLTNLYKINFEFYLPILLYKYNVADKVSASRQLTNFIGKQKGTIYDN